MSRDKDLILIVDDDSYLREEIEHVIRRIGYRGEHAGSLSECRNVLSEAHPLVVLLDIQLPDGSGLELLPELAKLKYRPEVVVISGAASLQEAADAVKMGATDFLEKPFEPDRLAATLNNAVRLARLKRENRKLVEDKLRAYELVGVSNSMSNLRRKIEQIAPTDARVLITGESGTGKELVAGQVHYQSRRASGSFIRVNCSALPGELAESELFGHEKGAFTGAEKQRHGRFEAASGGTLLLDEIGDMPIGVQPKLLRALETGEFERLGSTESLTADVRVLASTNRDLSRQIEEGAFREDLLYRINTVPLHVIPLRERREDIPVLAEHFLGRMEKESSEDKALDPEAVGVLAEYDWPGNVRELKNVIERVYYTSLGLSISADDILSALGFVEPAVDGEREDVNRLTAAIEGFERAFLKSHLDAADGNVSELARGLGIDRGNLYRKLKKLGLL